MFEKVKLALRLTGAAFDDEIKGLIAAAKEDLRLVGIVVAEDEDPDDPLIVRAIILYCKGNFGYTDNAERFIKAYDLLKGALVLAKKRLEGGGG